MARCALLSFNRLRTAVRWPQPRLEHLLPTCVQWNVQLLTPKGRIRNEMKLADQLQHKREEILRVAAKHGAGNVFVFGSVARGEEAADSDVDLLVDVAGEPTPWFPGGLVADLEELLGRRVQVVVRRSLSPLIRESVLKDASPL